MIEADLGRIITSKKYTAGTVYISDLTNNMWAVTVLDRDNIIMKNNEELETLREFKKGIDEQEKAKVVNSLMEEVEKFLDPEMMKSLRDEGMKCELCDMDAWSNKVKAMSFSAISKSKKKNSDIWSFSAPINNQKNNKSNSVWDRI